MIFRWRSWRRICDSIFLGLCVLYTDRNTQKFLSRQSQSLAEELRALVACFKQLRIPIVTYQWYWFRISELNIGDAFEAFRFIACDQTNIAYFSNTWKEFLQIARSNTLWQLHAEYGACVQVFIIDIVGWSASVAEAIRWSSATSEWSRRWCSSSLVWRTTASTMRRRWRASTWRTAAIPTTILRSYLFIARRTRTTFFVPGPSFVCGKSGR